MTSTLYRSGFVHAPGTPRATALLMDSDAGQVVWVGTDEAAARLGAPDVEVDLDGRLMVPAFVDAWGLDRGSMAMRAAVEAGIGTVHVLATSPTDGAGAEWGSASPLGPRVVRYEQVDAGSLDSASLTQRFEQGTQVGEQIAVVVRDPEDFRRTVIAAAVAAGRTGLARFVAVRHRLQVAGGVPVEVVAELAHLGLVVCLGAADGDGLEPAADDGRPLRALAAAGVAFAFGSAGAPADPWAWVHRASVGGEHAISVRAAFTAATRGGHRASRADDAGLLRPGAPATFAVWDFEGELVVRSPDDRVAAWSTDPRAATPGLPELREGSLPRCRRTVVDGRTVFDDGGLG